MEEQLSSEERERMRRAAALAKVAGGIAAKWTWFFIIVFLVLFTGFAVYLIQRTAVSQWRYTAVTRLLYIPRQNAKVAPIGDRQLMRILDRASLKRRVGEGMMLPPGEKDSLTWDLEIVQEGRPSNLYTLTARSRSRAVAVRKVNTYADILREEYTSYRTQELESWGGSAGPRQEEIRTEINSIEAEEAMLAGQVGTPQPIEALTAVNGLLGDQRRSLVMLNVDLLAEEAKRDKFEEELGDAGTAILDRSGDIRKLSESLAAMDAEIAKLREVYTDLNPKVKGKLEDRAALAAQYQAILEEFGIPDAGPGRLEAAERAATGLMEAEARAIALREETRNLEESLAANEERAERLSSVAPQMARLRARREGLERNLRDLEEELEANGYQQATAQSDLQQIERAENAWDKNPLRIENFLLAAGGAAACTGALAVWVVALGLWMGRVRGASELAALGDMQVLGSLPGHWAMRKREAKEAMEVVAIHFLDSPEAKGTVLVCRLKGAKPQPQFEETLEWSLSMAGMRLFLLMVVPPESGEIPQEGTETLLNTVRQGTKGWFPVVNRYSLAPTELQMLAADLARLREEFDCVFVMMHGGLRRGGNFTKQLLGVCDSALLTVGANRTRRSELSYIRRLVKEAGKPMLGLVTGARRRIIRKEMESSRW